MLRMKQKVTILSSLKNDGRRNNGVILGVELMPNGYYFGYKNRSEFLARYTIPRYKVAFIDCVTGRAGSEWFGESELRKGVFND